jgi:hypothetical protein
MLQLLQRLSCLAAGQLLRTPAVAWQPRSMRSCRAAALAELRCLQPGKVQHGSASARPCNRSTWHELNQLTSTMPRFWLAGVWLLQETVVATVTFTDRQSLELFEKLGLHVLPHWLGIRQGVQAGRAGRQGSTPSCGTAPLQLCHASET